jgi:hypothetical protein
MNISASAPSVPALRILPTSAAPTVFVASADGAVSVIDTIAVDQAVRGKRHGWNLTIDEICYAVPFVVGVLSYSVISSRLGISGQRLKELFPELALVDERFSRPGPRTKQPAPCGTARGYRAHHRKGEKACRRCTDANSAADRHYRTHGTYVGAPEVAA